MFTEVKGDLIKMALRGDFDVIAHGCNCFCTMQAGIAVPMARTFGCDKYILEDDGFKGDINKLGQIEYEECGVKEGWLPVPWKEDSQAKRLYVVNCYTQYHYGSNHPDGKRHPLDYVALRLCMRKMNKVFKGKHLGLPWIGCGLAGGVIHIVREIMKGELSDCKVTLVEYEKQK